MYVYPGKTTPDFGPSLSSDTPYGRLILSLRAVVPPEQPQEMIRVLELRATIMRFFSQIPGAHYWINLRKDAEGFYWDIGVHPNCAQYLGHFESVKNGLAGARYKVALKEIK